MKKGKFIAIYGINGIGKTTQVEVLVKYLQSKGKKASRLKYPVYDLEPEGPFLYKYLRDPEFRKKNELSTDELQQKYVDNRVRYEKELKKRLEEGEWIVAEDYIGTGVAWGLTWGGNLEYLEGINADLKLPDLSILMHGERFNTAIEKDHRNEMEVERIRICKNFHLLLAKKYKWEIVNANQSVEKVQSDIARIVEKH
ncbi:dTMP kinase [Patescibacteria group bacterium]